MEYYSYRVMAAHCYFIYNGDEKTYYTVNLDFLTIIIYLMLHMKINFWKMKILG